MSDYLQEILSSNLSKHVQWLVEIYYRHLAAETECVALSFTRLDSLIVIKVDYCCSMLAGIGAAVQVIFTVCSFILQVP